MYGSMEPMKILFGYVVKGFAEWFTQNRVEIELAYKESEAESVFETLETPGSVVQSMPQLPQWCGSAWRSTQDEPQSEPSQPGPLSIESVVTSIATTSREGRTC